MLHLSLTTIGDNACSLLIMPSEPCASSVNKPSHILAYMSYMLRCGIWLVGAPECIAVYALMPPAAEHIIVVVNRIPLWLECAPDGAFLIEWSEVKL